MRLSTGSHALPGWWWRRSLLRRAPPVPPAQPDPAATDRAELQAAGNLIHQQLQGAVAAAAPREGRQRRAEWRRSCWGSLGARLQSPGGTRRVRAPCRAQAAIAVCSKIAFNMTRGVGWARERWLSLALPLPRACLHCHMLFCRILHRALFVIL